MTLYLKDYEPLFKKALECDRLSPNEEEFLHDLELRQEEYGDGTYLSEKQLNWLKAIAEKS